MEQNLNIYQIALRYCAMALLVGVGAGISDLDGFVGILGYILMALGMITFLVCVLGMDPTQGENTEAKAAAKKDFIEQ